jgi:hypothetical protein
MTEKAFTAGALAKTYASSEVRARLDVAGLACRNGAGECVMKL